MQHHDNHDQPRESNRDPNPDPNPNSDGPDSGLSASLSGANGKPLDEISRAAGDEVFDILAGVQTQIERLRGLHHSHDQKLTVLTRRSAETEAAEQEISQRQIALQQQQAALAEHEGQLAESREQVEASQAQLDERRGELERQQAQLSEQEAREAKERAEVERRAQDLEQREVALQKLRTEFSPERFDALSDRCQSLQDQLTDAESRITEMSREFDDRAESLNREAESTVAALTEQVRELEATRTEHSASLEEFRQKTQAAEEENCTLSETLDEQQARFEEEAKAKATVQDQLGTAENQIIDLSEKLDHGAQQIDAKDQQCREAEEQIQSLQEQVTELKSTVAETSERAESLNREAESKVEALAEQLRERSASSDEYRDKFQVAQERIRDLADTLEEQQSRLEEGGEAIAAVQEQREQITELTNKLAHHQVARDPEQLRQKDERIEELVEALRQARGQSPGEQSHADSEARVHELTTENDQLKVEAERAAIEAQEAWRRLEQQGPDGTQGDGDANEAQRLAVKAQHLQRRRVRLARMRRALRGRTRPQSNATPESNPIEQIAALRDAIEASERELIRKWARPSAVVTLGWFTLLAISIAGVSWFGADHFVPATVSASVTFEAKTGSGQQLSSEESQAWRVWHTELLADTGFTNTLVQRLADRRLDRFADPGVLRQRLQADLTIDAMQDGLMTVSLAGTDQPEITALLDTLATTFVSESSRRISKRGGAHAVVKGGTSKGGRVTYATINPVPIHDERLKFAAYIFGGLFPVCLLLMVVIYRRLARAKSVFDGPDAIFAVPAI